MIDNQTLKDSKIKNILNLNSGSTIHIISCTKDVVVLVNPFNFEYRFNDISSNINIYDIKKMVDEQLSETKFDLSISQNNLMYNEELVSDNSNVFFFFFALTRTKISNQRICRTACE
jgi:HJR/Mrr/RecB family endonuclease